MKEKISILHISDLHRAKDNSVTNSALLTSLINDMDKYTTNEKPRINSPDIIIVCGDIIKGSSNKEYSDQEIQQQYDDSTDFLTELANSFLGGDKDKIILVPGNHDVDWKYSKESMEQIDSAQIFDSNNQLKMYYLKQAINQHSEIRWSWTDLSFYKVKDTSIYQKRFKAYASFYSKFYDGKRSYSLSPESQYDIFDFPDYAISIIGYNSCYNTDHLNFMGEIHSDCIAQSTLKLRNLMKKGRLLLAVWHHNTKGMPYETNYMGSSKLKNFIDAGIVMGFHGHQHRTELVREYNNMIEQKRIIVFSAGTLCGGHRELPTGQNQQYNIVEIEINPEDDSRLKITLHAREKTSTSSFDNPIWSQGRIDSTNFSYITTSVPKPIQPTPTADLLFVETIMKKNEYKEAKRRLLELDLNDPFVRKYLLESLLHTDDYDAIWEHFYPPKNTEETVYLLNSLLQLRNKENMTECLNHPSVKDNSDPAVKDLKIKIGYYLS